MRLIDGGSRAELRTAAYCKEQNKKLHITREKGKENGNIQE